MTKAEFLSMIEHFFAEKDFDAITDLEIALGKAYVIINKTADLWLSEAQFNAITHLVGSQRALYVVQSDSDDVYRLVLPTSYNEYYNLNLFSLSFIAPESFDWVIVIDEGVEFGRGVLIGNEEFVNTFVSTKVHGLITQAGVQVLYEFFCETWNHCGGFLLECPDEDIEYSIFEEFDSDSISFLHVNTLIPLRLSGKITKGTFDMSVELSSKFRALEGTELWNVQAVRNSEKWLEVLELSDRIKDTLKC